MKKVQLRPLYKPFQICWYTYWEVSTEYTYWEVHPSLTAIYSLGCKNQGCSPHCPF